MQNVEPLKDESRQMHSGCLSLVVQIYKTQLNLPPMSGTAIDH